MTRRKRAAAGRKRRGHGAGGDAVQQVRVHRDGAGGGGPLQPRCPPGYPPLIPLPLSPQASGNKVSRQSVLCGSQNIVLNGKVRAGPGGAWGWPEPCRDGGSMPGPVPSRPCLPPADHSHERLHHPRGPGQRARGAALRGEEPQRHPAALQEVQQRVSAAPRPLPKPKSPRSGRSRAAEAQPRAEGCVSLVAV